MNKLKQELATAVDFQWVLVNVGYYVPFKER